MSASSSFPQEGELSFDQHLLAVLESLHDGFMSLDASWRSTYVNRAAEQLLDIQREDLLFKPLWEVFPELVGSTFWKACYQAAEMQQSMEVEDLFPATGQWLRLRLSPHAAGLVLSLHQTTSRNPSPQEGQGDQDRMQLLVSLMELADDAIIVRDPASVIVSWNRGAEHLYGWTAQEALEQVTHDLFQTQFPCSREALDRLLATRTQWEGELIHTCKDGSQVIVESRQVVVRHADNTPIAIMEINRDVTKRKQHERENRKQEEAARLQLAALVESADVPIIGKTPEGIITSWNAAAEQMYGYRKEEAVGHPITLIFPPDRQNEFVSIMERIRRGEQVDLYETVRQRKNGTRFPVSITVSPIYDGAGRLIGASDIAHDITERNRLQAHEQFLTEVSRVLSSTLDYQQTLTNVARLVVPQLADWFAVDLVDASGHFELVELAHQDPEKVQWARMLRERYPLDPDGLVGAARVARTGRAELYTEIPDEVLIATTRNEEHLALARQIGFSSAMLVPLIARGRTIGVVSFVATESRRRYDERDLALAEEVGRRAGVALDNARLYRAVQQSRDQLEIILQGVADGIIVYATENHILYVNEAAAQMTGYASVQQMLATQQSAILGKYEIIDEQGQPFPVSGLTHRRVFAGEPEATAIIGYREKVSSQPVRWSLVKARPVRGEHGEVAMVITIIHDITERMNLERRKDEFISMASHELKTPLTSLKGFLQVLQRRLLRQTQPDPQALHYLARMDAQIEKLTSLINELLDISRMQSGKLLLRTEPIDLDSLIAEMVETVQATTSTHQISIEGSTSAHVLGDRERLGQVFLNLLTNAIKYSPGESRMIVRLSLDDDGQHARVAVQDFGIGIDPVHHEKIFERFYQVTDPEEKTYPGLGIGLYISNEIVTRHQGRMWVESRKGQGSTFFVALPRLLDDRSAQTHGRER